jgi:chromosome segregation ATPase
MEKTLNLILDKLGAMDQRLDKMDQRLDKMEQRLDAMDQRFDAMDQRFDAMDQKIDSMDKRLTTELNRQGDLIHQLINTVAATNVKISETNEKLTALETKVDTVIDEVKEIKNSMATKHDLEYYDQMISEHSRQIYKLKNH